MAGGWGPGDGRSRAGRAPAGRPRNAGPRVLDEFPSAGCGRRDPWVGPLGNRANYLFIWDIWVEPERRGEGLGTAALQALEELARSQGVQKVGLHVFGWNVGARRLYARMGFVETDVSMEKRL